MHTSVGRAGLAGMVVLAFLALAMPRAVAQPVTPAGQDDPMFLGLPSYYSPSTDLSFYSNDLGQGLETIFTKAQEAARDCDRESLARYRAMFERTVSAHARDVARAADELSRTPSTDPQAAGRRQRLLRDQHDLAQLLRAFDKFGRLEESCPKEKKVGALMDLFLQGGGALAFQSGGFFRSIDTIGDEQRDAFGGAVRSTGVFGGGARLNVLKINPTVFFEARFQTAFGAPSFQQTAGLSGFGAPFQAPFGESLVRENWGIPLLLGTSWSLGSLGSGGPELGLDVYGGITIANWTQSLAGGEADVPGTPTYASQQTRTSVDPTFGVGLRVPTIDLNGDGRADIVVGIYGELAFRQGSSITALSPSNTGNTYTGWVDSRATGSLMLRLSVPLGGGPLFRAD